MVPIVIIAACCRIIMQLAFPTKKKETLSILYANDALPYISSENTLFRRSTSHKSLVIVSYSCS